MTEHSQTYDSDPPPNPNWKPGDDPYSWPYGFVGISTYPGVCGVYVENTSMKRCLRREDDPIHHTEDKRA